MKPSFVNIFPKVCSFKFIFYCGYNMVCRQSQIRFLWLKLTKAYS